ncbi:hypothetical protein C2G38_2077260 [Gigaspora rosea]|uniref:Uncharacterized protein n=1 Tax=Gigaspora rosea TaxID=44941 RepID=A0A397VPF0_9GLOM|nr:hypothetical protein C2G38_2077260 [Gigaspora rosea]
MMYSSYLLESWKSKHQIDKVEEVTSTKRRKDLTNASFEDDSRNNTAVVAYSGKSMDDRSILESADSKMNQVNNNSHSSSSVPSSNFNREEDIDPEYYDVKKRAKILYSWEGAINKIDFKVNSKKDVKEKPYLYYKKDMLSNIMLIESTKPTYLTCNHEIWNEVCQRQTYPHSMFELVWANSKSSTSNKKNTNKCKKPDFKLMNNKGNEILFGEVKPKDSLSILAKKDLTCAQIRIYEIDLNYDGIYRMILIANIITPTEHAQFLNLVTVLETFYNIIHRISEVLTIITSNTTPNSPSRSTYSRETTPSPKPVRITISGLQPN